MDDDTEKSPVGDTSDAHPKPVAKHGHESSAKKPSGRQPAVARLKWSHIVGLVIAVAIVAAFGARYWLISSMYAATDDAYLTNDLIQVSPQVNGIVKKVLVSDNQVVKAGDLIVVLDDATYRETVAQKQADLDAAIAQARGAGLSVALTSETGTAQLLQAHGIVFQAESGISSARTDVIKSAAATENATAEYMSAEASIGTARAGLDAAVANRKRNEDAIKSAAATLEAAQATVRAAQALYGKAALDADRASTLVTKGAISAQMNDAANSASLASKAQLENVQALVAERQADLDGARRQLDASTAEIEQAKAQLAVATAQASAARRSVDQARAQRTMAEESVVQAQARHQQAVGQLDQAQTSPRQVAVSRSVEEQAMAKIEQARAALDDARLQLSYTRIYAPVSGRISKKTVEEGALVEIGTPLMAVVPLANIWVVANFKETQLAGMRQGQKAEIYVDAVPGRVFRASVDSLASATGSTFALLPPDNATGNFVKVVQRLPVKIIFDPNQPDMDYLHAGMSVTAEVKVK